MRFRIWDGDRTEPELINVRSEGGEEMGEQ